MTKATNTHLAYVILNAFPLYQWLYVRTHFLVTLYEGGAKITVIIF